MSWFCPPKMMHRQFKVNYFSSTMINLLLCHLLMVLCSSWRQKQCSSHWYHPTGTILHSTDCKRTLPSLQSGDRCQGISNATYNQIQCASTNLLQLPCFLYSDWKLTETEAFCSIRVSSSGVTSLDHSCVPLGSCTSTIIQNKISILNCISIHLREKLCQDNCRTS